MFTGIVQTQAEVLSAVIENNSLKLKITLDKRYLSQLAIGASVANNGVCLTVVEFGLIEHNKTNDQGYMCFDVIDETLRVTNLHELNQGDRVNVERSLKMGDELGGHIVSGHIHGVAKVIHIKKDQYNCQVDLQCSDALMKYILPKGFITLNGISLTVGDVVNNIVSVHLIPETLKITNLGSVQLFDKLNIELDQQTVTIVDTIERMQLTLKHCD
ncbi:MAG: riboflavin synthase subunit alpha [Thalassotalea sp.]